MSPSRLRRPAAAAAVLSLATLGAVAVATPASAVTYPVATEADLLAAIGSANASAGVADVIQISGFITLTGNLPPITDDTTIVGVGADPRILANNFGALNFLGLVGDRITGAVTDLSITGGTNAFQAHHTNLTVERVTIQTSTLPFSFGNGNLSITDFTSTLNPGNGANITISGSDAASITNAVLGEAGSGNSNGMFLTANDNAAVTIDGLSANDNANTSIVLTANDSARIVASTVTSSGSTNGRGLQIAANDSSEIQVSGATANSNANDEGVAVDAQDDSSVLLQGITANANAGGFEIRTSDNSIVTVESSFADSSAGQGITAISVGDSSARLFGVSATNTIGADGISLTASGTADQVLVDALAFANGGSGIRVGNAAGPGGIVNIIGTTASNNGVIGSSGGGLEVADPEDMLLYVGNSTFSNNIGNVGGGILVAAGVDTLVELAQVTVSGNQGNFAAGVRLQSTGVTPASIVLRNSTVTDNTAEFGPDGVEIDSEDSEISNTIISGNGNGDSDLEVDSLIQADYNLVGFADATATTELNAGTGNLIGAALNLGALADNGGSTLTHLPLTGSAAINAGEPGFALIEPTDQRNAARIVGGRVDIGAVETAAAIVPAPGALAATGPSVEAAVVAAGGLLSAGIAALLFTAPRRRRRLTVG